MNYIIDSSNGLVHSRLEAITCTSMVTNFSLLLGRSVSDICYADFLKFKTNSKCLIGSGKSYDDWDVVFVFVLW